MKISQVVLDKIKEEEQKHPHNEFGGFLIVKPNGYVKDIIFDMSKQTAGSVNLGTSALLKLNPKQRKMVNGWFHKHPINGLSWTDINTTTKLTKLWDVCYTMVLQANGQMLIIKTIKGKRFENVPFSLNYNYGDFPEAVWPEINIMSSLRNINPFKSKPKDDKEKEPTTETTDDLKKLKPVIDKDVVVEVFREEFTFTSFEKEKLPAIQRYKKFKAWDTLSQTMSKPFSIELLLKEQTIHFPSSILQHKDIVDRLFKNSLIILQYTGFYDITKEEIYETDKISFITSFNIKKTGIVEFHNGAWQIAVYENSHINYFNIRKEAHNLEIISTIQTESEEIGPV